MMAIRILPVLLLILPTSAVQLAPGFWAANVTQGPSGWYAWLAKPWGRCRRRMGDQAYRSRVVECVNIVNATPVAEELCDHMEKPCCWTSCHCGAVTCRNNSDWGASQPPCLDESMNQRPGHDSKFLGCLKNTTLPPPVLLLGDSSFDLGCMSCSGHTPCHGGLAFFRKNLTPGDDTTCAKFCRTKGMDISGFRPGGECLCGSSAINTGVFHFEGHPVRRCLLFPFGAVSPGVEGECEVNVFRWGGCYVNGAVPPIFVETRVQEDAYIDSIVSGRLIFEESFDGSNSSNREIGFLSEQESTIKTSNASWTRMCWPGNCGPGNGPWPVRYTEPIVGVREFWKEYVYLRYVFDSNVDDGRKDAFRLAVDKWHQAACINFIEVDTLSNSSTYDLKIVVVNVDSCYTRGVGDMTQFGDDAFSEINLGWCNSVGQLGSIVHEIGHVLGMAHEQKRPDATVTYFGKGPYLKLYWDTIDSAWIPQWLPDENSYTGSANDGAEDPWVGYAPYDFQSIMHYGLSAKRGETIPPQARQLTGQRRALSVGDVRQIWDMYQCVTKASTTTTTTPSYPHFALIDDVGQHFWTGEALSCELTDNSTCVQSFGYPQSYANEQKCVFTAAISGFDLNVIEFSTELGYDQLYVGDVGFSGATSPQNVAVQTGELIIWTSDYTLVDKGWKICTPATPAPTPSPTVSSTETTTTTMPLLEPKCMAWCDAHTASWASKCTWHTCGQCSACLTGDPFCAHWCTTNSKPWSQKCSYAGCSVCDDCHLVTPAPTPGSCKSWCTPNTSPWASKCSWPSCSSCEDCPCWSSCSTNSHPWSRKCNWAGCLACQDCGSL